MEKGWFMITEDLHIKWMTTRGIPCVLEGNRPDHSTQDRYVMAFSMKISKAEDLVGRFCMTCWTSRLSRCANPGVYPENKQFMFLPILFARWQRLTKRHVQVIQTAEYLERWWVHWSANKDVFQEKQFPPFGNQTLPELPRNVANMEYPLVMTNIAMGKLTINDYF